jgi:GR25 family glycosyltransferase involved in LPS biosynthesis
MRIAITSRFQNSYFSGSTPQNSILLGKLLKSMGHEVVLLKPVEDPDWFIDIAEEAKNCPPRVTWDKSSTQTYDLVVEATWNLPTDVRPKIAKRIALFQHYSPLFYDMESSVYHFNPLHRDFTNLTEIWTWNHWHAQDIRYLEFLSGKPVYQIPFVSNFDALDIYCKEAQVPSWFEGARNMDSRVTAAIPPSMSWSARILESNMSNTSHCLVPLNIVSEIRKVDPIRFSVHNGEHVFKNAFFQANVAKNLILPDASGNFIPRIRLPDLCREKSLIIAHQRFRPIKGFMVDALYLGIPILHNCDMLKGFGYKYELNQIQDAVVQWLNIKSDYENRRGYFAENAGTLRKLLLRKKFGLELAKPALEKILETQVDAKSEETTGPVMKIEEIADTTTSEIRVAFCDMWDQFQPEHNFFMSLLRWAGKQHNFSVRTDYDKPTLVIFGPFGESHKRYAGVPKVFFTGENLPPNKEEDTFLNLGYQYTTDANYIRLPLWVLEINWFNEDPDKVVNPRPVSLSTCLKQDSAVLDAKKKFCAFVATNPKCQNRNIAFHILNQWRGVDSGGRLFCNLAEGPIPAGLGGGGGELAKVDFYKQYKYAITYENESSPGYATEKLFHAKVAGCVPIYWGDKYVDRDFDSAGFINANSVSSPEELIRLVEKVENDPELWRKMAEVPALSEYKRNWCLRTMEEIVRKIVQKLFQKSLEFSEFAWTSEKTPTIETLQTSINASQKREKRIVTAANKRFIPSVRQLIQTAKLADASVPVIVYVWPDVSEEEKATLKEVGGTVEELPVSQSMGFSDFWEPQHFAWKLWIHAEQSKQAPKGTLILYMDAGIDIVFTLDKIWNHIQKEELCVFDDAEQTNKRWCHPTFCDALQVTEAELTANQIWAGCMGFVAGGKYHESVIQKALEWAKRREVIVGDKWKPYSATCFGHRHDQSILSILTQRAGVPRMPLRDVYCDKSRRTAENWGTPLYVHRGNPRLMAPFAPGIDEAYVINLEHRKDRLEKFKQNPNLKDFAYVWKATDGRKLTMNTNLARLFRDNDFKWKKSVMGCAISHMGLWEKLANDPVAKSYLIMEDDVRFSPDWYAKWMSAASHIPADTDVIYLGGVLPPNKPALPQVTEPVNPYFARVAKNSLFGGVNRRYFHFCNYSYILTQNGARKLIKLIQQRGIFTSGDHMIVNHGDGYLNLYFTTPLLTDCLQEDDPVYQKSEFNNFNRVDTFDSDIWNNVECFSQKEITDALAEDMRKIDIKVVSEPLSESELKRLNEEHAKKQESSPPQPSLTKEQLLNLWNTFLRAVATRKSAEVAASLTTILDVWKTPSSLEDTKQWIKVFEKLITTNHPEIQNHKVQILEFLRVYGAADVWNGIKAHWNIQVQPPTAVVSAEKSQLTIYQLAGGDSLDTMMEYEWIQSMFGPFTLKSVNLMHELLSSPTPPVLLYQNPGGKEMSSILHQIVNVFGNVGKQLILLHMSDEFARNDVSMYSHPAVKHVFRNYWRPDLPTDKVTFLPLGYTKGRGSTQQHTQSFSQRELIWSFVGSEDRPGRSESLRELTILQPNAKITKPRWDTPAILDGQQYSEVMRKTKFVPCMKGSTALESFRMYEALEHGAIPVYVPAESHQCADEYKQIFGNHPLLAVPSWAEAANFLKLLSEKPEVMENHRQTCEKWWKLQKEELRSKIHKIVGA